MRLGAPTGGRVLPAAAQPMKKVTVATQPQTAGDTYIAVQQTPEFQALRRKFRGFVFPMTAFFLSWYFLYVLLSIFASSFMNKILFGKITVGLIFGLLQFVTTFAITFIYARWANRELDPAAEGVSATIAHQEGR